MKLRMFLAGAVITTGLFSASAVLAAAPSLSQTSLTLSVGQSSVISLQSALNSVYILSNTNSAIANIFISGSQITITGNQTGTAAVNLCYNGSTSDCSTLSITVQSSSSGTGGTITFDQPNPSISTGASLSITIMGANSFYVKSNSNLNAITYQLNNNVINMTGAANGSTVLTICSAISADSCGQLNVTVGGGSSGTTSSGSSGTTTSSGVSFSNNNPTVGVSQTVSVNLSGATTYFVSVNSNPIAVQTSVSSNVLMITGVAAGTTQLTICAAGGSVCGTIPVTVTTSATTPAPAPVVTTPTPVYAPVPVVNTLNTVTTSASLVATIQLMQNQLAQLLAAIQAMQTQLQQLLATATPATASVSASASSAPAAAFTGKFVSFLSVNSTGPEVTALQKKLSADGYYSGPITGTFGPLTASGLKKFQEANGLDPAGYVGPSTRAALNQ